MILLYKFISRNFALNPLTFTIIFFFQISEQNALPNDPAKDANFKEDRIDKLRVQKDEELDRYRRTLERASARQWNNFDQSLKY